MKQNVINDPLTCKYMRFVVLNFTINMQFCHHFITKAFVEVLDYESASGESIFNVKTLKIVPSLQRSHAVDIFCFCSQVHPYSHPKKSQNRRDALTRSDSIPFWLSPNNEHLAISVNIILIVQLTSIIFTRYTVYTSQIKEIKHVTPLVSEAEVAGGGGGSRCAWAGQR